MRCIRPCHRIATKQDHKDTIVIGLGHQEQGGRNVRKEIVQGIIGKDLLCNSS